MDTIRELIIRDIVSRLAVIRKVAGYSTDCGQAVFRVRPRIDPGSDTDPISDPGDAPCIDVWPEPEESEFLHARELHKMPVQIEGFLPFGNAAVKRGLAVTDEDASTVAERILGDIQKAIGDPSWSRSPNYIERIVYTGGGTYEYPAEEEIFVAAAAKFEFHYYTKKGNPFEQ